MASGHRDATRLSVSICGTFNAGLPSVAAAVDYFQQSGVAVLSPADPTPVDVLDGFLFVASDGHRDKRLVERRHLEAIAVSDLVWLVAPEGYVGVSGAAEVAFSAGRRVPVFTADDVLEPAIACLVWRVPSPQVALDRCRSSRRPVVRPPFLVDTYEGSDWLHGRLDGLWRTLTSTGADTSTRAAGFADDIRQALSGL
jgi:hypothetical protein